MEINKFNETKELLTKKAKRLNGLLWAIDCIEKEISNYITVYHPEPDENGEQFYEDEERAREMGFGADIDVRQEALEAILEVIRKENK